jgi:uncharacterized protein (TIGR02145 family)
MRVANRSNYSPGDTYYIYGFRIARCEGLSKISGTMTDQDGNVYATIKIGNQWWMAENLKVTHYRNGDAIPNVTDDTEWGNLTSGAYCAYNNDNNNIKTYGLLYNWYSIDDNRNIAPEGWHVPTDEEWKQLEQYLGMSQTDADAIGYRGTDEGGKLKITGTTYWYNPNTGATNETGFTGLGSGYRDYNGSYVDEKIHGVWWTTDEYDESTAYHRTLNYEHSQSYRNNNFNKRAGVSVRLIKD